MQQHVRVQLEGLKLNPDLPLIVSDADEVLAYFIAGLERYLDRNGFWLDLTSFALTGNIRKKGSDTASTPSEVKDLLADFFDHDTELMDPVAGAADALRSLSMRAQIIVLSNVPPAIHAARQRWLHRHDMGYPLIANDGSKGLPLRHLAERMKAPVFFLDDLPPHLDAVAEQAKEVCLVHFIADKRLAALVGPAKNCHFHSSHWPDTHDFIHAQLDQKGF